MQQIYTAGQHRGLFYVFGHMFETFVWLIYFIYSVKCCFVWCYKRMFWFNWYRPNSAVWLTFAFPTWLLSECGVSILATHASIATLRGTISMAEIVFELKYDISPVTHWGRDKMATILQTTFSKTFSWMKMYECWCRFNWSLFLRFQLAIFQHWFR